jgi:hypothetical protein
MGGMGSGRRWTGKDTTSDYQRLDIRRLNRGGWLREGISSVTRWYRGQDQVSSISIRAESDRVYLSYRHQSRGGSWETLEYPVELDYTACRLGGSRVWFRCPNRGCGRRAAILYSGRYFVCRHCLGLAYECQREAPHFRALRKAQKLSDRLGGSGCIDEPVFRPRGMHQSTFERLEREYERRVAVTNGLAAAHFGLLTRAF